MPTVFQDHVGRLPLGLMILVAHNGVGPGIPKTLFIIHHRGPWGSQRNKMIGSFAYEKVVSQLRSQG